MEERIKELIEIFTHELGEAEKNKFFGKTGLLRAYGDGKHTILEWVLRELKKLPPPKEEPSKTAEDKFNNVDAVKVLLEIEKGKVEDKNRIIANLHKKIDQQELDLVSQDREIKYRDEEIEKLNSQFKQVPSEKRVTDEEIERMARDYVKKLPAINYKSAYDFGIQNISAFKYGFKKALSLALPSEGKEVEWISVEEKLPEFDVQVLVHCRIYGRFIATYERIAGNWGNWRHNNELGILPPTHWMPLPNPPKSKNSTKNI